MGAFAKAVPLCRQGVSICKKRYGAGSVEYANELVKLVQLLFHAQLVWREQSLTSKDQS
jgi:hypothetical protein